MYPVLFRIGDFTFYSFGLMLALSIIVPAFFVCLPLFKRHGVPKDFIYEAILATAVGGILGARIWYMLEHWSKTVNDFWGVVFTGEGFTWYGGLVGGFVLITLLCVWRKVPLGLLFNIAAPGLAIGYGIGRIGCQLAGDGDYGKPSDLPWAMGYPNGTVPTPPGVEVHPTPVYETLAMIVVFVFLYWLARQPQPGWYVFGWYLVLTGAERLLVEFIRINPIWFAGLTQPQWAAIASIIVGTALIIALRGRAPVLMRPATATSGAGGGSGARADGGGDSGSQAGRSGGSSAGEDGSGAERPGGVAAYRRRRKS